MQVSLIAAMSENQVIGIQCRLPWHLPADLQHFKAITMGKPVVMGRHTFESIGKPLVGRENIIITRRKEYKVPGCIVVSSVEEALSQFDVPEIMIIGGAMLYQETLSMASRMYLTIIHHHFEGDAYFPTWREEEWEVVEREDHSPDAKNAFYYSFLTLNRLQGILKT